MMKTYSFAPISAREYPTIALLDNPYIWGGVKYCVNVSEKPYPEEIVSAMKEKGIYWIHCPVSEDEGTRWDESLDTALRALYKAVYHWENKVVVHCDWGNNRSRSFIEALAFLLTGKHIEDEYHGEINHLAYNCKIGHLPPLGELERRIVDIKAEEDAEWEEDTRVLRELMERVLQDLKDEIAGRKPITCGYGLKNKAPIPPDAICHVYDKDAGEFEGTWAEAQKWMDEQDSKSKEVKTE